MQNEGLGTRLPDALTAELARMRRHPEEFTVAAEVRCKLCYEKTAVDLAHPGNPHGAGTWCPVHGWLAFDSVRIPPDEAMPKMRKMKSNTDRK